MFWFKKNKRGKAKVYKIVRPKIKYKNPLLIKKGLFKFKLFKIVNILLLICILGCIYFFILSDFYSITEIKVTGNQVVSTDDILEVTNNYLITNTLFFLKNRNIFIFNRNKLAKNINDLVILEDIKIEKILPGTITINIKEKNAALKWITANNEYLLDNQGQIIKRYYKMDTAPIFLLNFTDNQKEPGQNTATSNDLLKIKNLGDQAANLGDFVLRETDLTLIKNLIQAMKNQEHLKIIEFQVPNVYPQYISAIMADNWQIYLNFNDSLEMQLNRLQILIDQKIKKESLNKLEYIDLRLGESIYYKFKGQKQQSPESTENTE